MIYAKLHTYNETEVTVITTIDKVDDTWQNFDVPNETWLEVEKEAIKVLSEAEHEAKYTPAINAIFTPLEFLDKFTDEEQLAVVTATMVNPQLKLWYDKMLGASMVDLSDARTIGGLEALVQFGLIDANRRDSILGTIGRVS